MLSSRQSDRDLKPENFLFKGPGQGEGEPVIIDFGLSKMVDVPNEHMATRVGTSYYIAPEVDVEVLYCAFLCCHDHCHSHLDVLFGFS